MHVPYKYFKYWAELIDFMNLIASSLAVLFAWSIYFLSVDIAIPLQPVVHQFCHFFDFTTF